MLLKRVMPVLLLAIGIATAPQAVRAHYLDDGDIDSGGDRRDDDDRDRERAAEHVGCELGDDSGAGDNLPAQCVGDRGSRDCH